MMFFVKAVCILLTVVPQLCLSCGPVSFTSPSFTIRGPCPNNTVLAAVGSTVQYRCDHEDTTGGINLPYWHIPELSGSPFLKGRGMDHGITIVNNIAGASGHTTVTIPVKEQYLNNTLNIQCGLCSLLVCANENRLSENITSTSVTLLSFGSPYNLHDSIQSSPLLIALSWSPPPVSMDYSNLSSYFTYEVKLTNQLNSSQAISFITNTTAANISARDIPDGHDVCGDYSWSITPIANGGIISRGNTTYSNNSISIPSVPLIKNGSFVANLSQCETTQLLSITFEVNSCSETGLKSTVLVTIADTVYNRTTRITTPVGPNSYMYAVRCDNIAVTESQFDFESNVSVDVQVENSYGNFEARYEIEVDTINIVTCVSVPVVPVPSTSSLAYSTMSTSEVRGTSDTSRHRGDTTSDIYSRSTYTRDESFQTMTPDPSVSPGLGNESQGEPIYVYIAVPVVMILIVVFVLVLVLVLVIFMKKKKSSMKVTSETEYATIEQKNCNGKKKAFMNGSGGGAFKYENVSMSTCSTPMDVTTPRLPLCSSTASADSDQHSQEDQPQQQQQPPNQHLSDNDGTYANPMDIQNGPILVNGFPPRNSSESKAGQPGRPKTQSLLFSTTNVSFDNPGYTQTTPSVERVVEAEYSEISYPSKKPSASSSNNFVNMPGYSEVHFDPKKQRRSWHNSRLNSTPKHATCSSLPATPAHIKTNPQSLPLFLKLGGIEETDGGITGAPGGGDKPGDAVYDDMVFNKENIQSGANSTSDAPIPEYVTVEEIKKRKNQSQQQVNPQQQQQHVLKFDEDMIELKELPPATPQHDRTTPPTSASSSTPPTTPPPVPPHPQSPSAVAVLTVSES